MALTTFNPTVRPSPGLDHKPKLNLRKAEFGDGYTQAAPAGLNHIRRSVSLKWEGLTQAQASSIIAFFEARGGYQAFYYTPFGLSSALKWTCEDWSMSADAPFAVRATLTQSFTLET